jgi:hypothetical protein
MNNLKTIIAFLVGKKTYIIGFLMIILGLLQGDDQMIFTGIGFLTLRNAIK